MDRNVIGECVAEIWWKRKVVESFFCKGRLFLWWLVVILVDGWGYALIFFFFLFSSCSGLWLPQWCLWLVVVAVVVGCGCYNGGYGKWSGGVGGGCYRFLCSSFYYYYYFNK